MKEEWGLQRGTRKLRHDRYLHKLDCDNGFTSVTFRSIKTYQITHLKHMQFTIYQLYLTKPTY